MASTMIDRVDGLSSAAAIKGPCRVATTGNISLYGLQTVDGVALADGNRVLVKNQTAGYENGIYVVDTGQWRRSKDFNRTKDVVEGTAILVNQGSTNSETLWVVTSDDPVIVGTDTITFSNNVATPQNNSVTNAKLADMATATIKGRATAGTGDPEDLTTSQVRDLLEISGKWDASLPYRSQIDRIRENGITPDDVVGTIVSGDAGPAISAMFDEGISAGVNLFKLMAGKTYEVDSWDAADATHAYGILKTAVTSDIIFDLNGGTIKGLSGIQESTVNPGAIARFDSAYTTNGESTSQRFVLKNGKVDMVDCPSSSSGVTTIGGLSLVGRWNIELRGVYFDHGITTAVGDAIGTGGGDQSFFASNWNSLLIDGCVFRGAPDLGVYLSNSGGRESRIVNNFFYRCQNGIAQKRYSSKSLIAFNRFLECNVGIYNPVADGETNNHGGALYITNNVLEKIQTNPVDIGGSSADGTTIQNNKFLGWCRRISDGAELTDSGWRHAVRVRVPNCIVSGNLFDLDGWTLTTTAGKQQIGIDFNYSGGDVATGAVDCVSFGNIFKDIYQAHNLGASTSLVRRFGNKRVNVTIPDADSGANILPYVLTDDTLVFLTPPQNRSMASIKSNQVGNGQPNGDYFINASGAPSVSPSGVERLTNITCTSAITTVGGAVDGNFTLSAVANGLYLINRTGGTVSFDLRWDQE